MISVITEVIGAGRALRAICSSFERGLKLWVPDFVPDARQWKADASTSS